MSADEAKGFWAIHSGLEREGPGSAASTRRALDLTGLDGPLTVIDVGCGPGAQTIVLAEALSEARILAVDLHAPFVDEVGRRATAAGVADRVSAVVGDMADLPRIAEAAGFGGADLVWSEGAAYVMGFTEALASWRPVLRSGGVLALTEPVWLAPTVPRAVRDFWDTAYPAMQPVGVRRAQSLHAGYQRIGDFILPRSDWDAYYDPIRARLADLHDTGSPAGSEEATAIAAVDEELAIFDGGGADAVGYAFVVLRRTDR